MSGGGCLILCWRAGEQASKEGGVFFLPSLVVLTQSSLARLWYVCMYVWGEDFLLSALSAFRLRVREGYGKLYGKTRVEYKLVG
jgi:hypothetical protein